MAAPLGATPKTCFMSNTIPARAIARDAVRPLAPWTAMYRSRRLRWPTMLIHHSDRTASSWALPKECDHGSTVVRLHHRRWRPRLSLCGGTNPRAGYTRHDPARGCRPAAPVQPAAFVERAVDRQGEARRDLRARPRFLSATQRRAGARRRDHDA